MRIIRFCFPHKTASMFAHEVMAGMAEKFGFSYFSPNNNPPNHTNLAAYIAKSSGAETVLFGPSRTYSVPPSITKAVQDGHNLYDVCQIRDPLDIMVSQYFSHGWIHPDRRWSEDAKRIRKEIQYGKLSVFEYAELELDGKSFFADKSISDKLKALEQTFLGTGRVIVKYEDFFHDYEFWAKEVSSFLFNPPQVYELLMDKKPDYKNLILFDDEVFFEDPLVYVEKYGVVKGKHIRTAAPGDHTRFLTQHEIHELRERTFAVSPTLKDRYS